jgi:hypothetical protein
MNLIEQINNHKYLYLTEIGEPKDNALRLLIEEAIVDEEEHDFKIANSVISGVRDIVSDHRCFAYEIIFESYIAYSVINESFDTVDESEAFTGKLFRTYSKSKFLDYLKTATLADEEYPGAFSHYLIAALNHIVNVASTDSPVIKVLRFPSS